MGRDLNDCDHDGDRQSCGPELGQTLRQDPRDAKEKPRVTDGVVDELKPGNPRPGGVIIRAQAACWRCCVGRLKRRVNRVIWLAFEVLERDGRRIDKGLPGRQSEEAG